MNLCLTFTGIQHDMSHILDMRKNTSKTIKIKKGLLTIYQFMWGMQVLSMLHICAGWLWSFRPSCDSCLTSHYYGVRQPLAMVGLHCFYGVI